MNNLASPPPDIGHGKRFECVPQNEFLHVRKINPGPLNPPGFLDRLFLVVLWLSDLLQHGFQILHWLLLLLDLCICLFLGTLSRNLGLPWKLSLSYRSRKQECLFKKQLESVEVGPLLLLRHQKLVLILLVAPVVLNGLAALHPVILENTKNSEPEEALGSHGGGSNPMQFWPVTSILRSVGFVAEESTIHSCFLIVLSLDWLHKLALLLFH